MIKLKTKIGVLLVIFILLICIFPRNVATIDDDLNIRVEQNQFKDKIFDIYIKIIMKICRIPSLSACTISDNRVMWAKAYGVLDPDINIKATNKTIYLVMSISKPVAATALMQLYEQGLFDLDDDVNNYLPFTLRNPNYPDVPITFRMLLAHQSSLAHDESGEMLEIIRKTECLGDPDIASYPYPWLENYLVPGGSLYVPDIWMDEAPGTEYHYANINYGLIGYLIEIISNQNFNDYCKEHIFNPLNMKNTSFLYADLNNDNIAIPYSTLGKQIFPTLVRQPLYSYLWAACGNLKTTTLDLSKFLIAHMNGGEYEGIRILKNETVEEMHSIQYPDNKGDKYGLGWMISEDNLGRRIYGHNGAGPGLHARMWVRPSDNIAFMYFSTSWTWRLTLFIPLLAFTFFQKANG